VEAVPDRPYRRLVLRGTLATGLGNVWAMVLGIVTLPLLLGSLGTEAFGVWVLLQTLSVTTGWLSLGDVGLTTSATRYVAAEQASGDHHAAGRVAGTALALFGALGVAWGAVLALLGPSLLGALFRVPEALTDGFRLAVLWTAAQAVADFVIRGALAILEGAQRVDRSRGLDVVRRTLATGGATVAAVAGGGLAGTAAASAVGTAVALGITMVVLVVGRDVQLGLPGWSSVGRLVRYGSAVAVLRPLGVLHRTMDRIVVGVALGPSAVTAVEIATQLQNGAEAVLAASSYAVTPTASWLDALGRKDRLHELVAVGTRYTLLATLPVVAVSMALAGPAIAVWVGPDHQDAVVLAVLALTYTAASAPLQVGSNLLVGTGHVRPVLRAAAVALSVNLILSIALVGPLGPPGVFLATVISGLALIPLLARPVFAAVDLGAREFVTASVLPPLRVAVLVGVAAGVPVLLPLPALPTLVAGGLAAVAAAGWAIPRRGMAPGELRGLLHGLRRPTGVAA
jgi:O-antigen/teichoic acid export membrane protein